MPLNLCERIAGELQAEIKSGRYRAHDKFHSEKQLSTRFGCNDATVRKAVDRLVASGLLYKKPSSGTFVAPDRKNRLILLVMPGKDDTLLRHCYTGDLMNSPYRFYEIPEREYLSCVEDIELFFPEICGVFFFRDPRWIRDSFKLLDQKNIVSGFYGSSVHEKLFADRLALFYNERDVVDLAMRQLWQQGCRNIGCLGGGNWVATLERQRHYLLWMQKMRRLPDPELILDIPPGDERYRHIGCLAELLREQKGKVDAFFCVADDGAALLLQAAFRAGLDVPRQLKVIGVNDSPICELIEPGISAVHIPIPEDCRRLIGEMINKIENRPFETKLTSGISFVRRGSA